MRRVTVFLLMFFISLMSYSDYEEGAVKRYTEPSELVDCDKYPWIVRLESSKAQAEYVGTGFIFNKKYVLTAAHVLDNTNCLKVKLYNACDYVEVDADAYLINSKYNGGKCDLAIVRLKQNVRPKNLIDNEIVFIDYYSQGDSLNENSSWIAAGYATNDFLKKARVSLLNLNKNYDDECPLHYPASYAGIGEPGDSGSPIFKIINNSTYILGVLYEGDDYDGGTDYYTPIINFTEPGQISDVIKSDNLFFSANGWSKVNCSVDVDVTVTVIDAFIAVAAFVLLTELVGVVGLIICLKRERIKAFCGNAR